MEKTKTSKKKWSKPEVQKLNINKDTKDGTMQNMTEVIMGTMVSPGS
jgi:hypothetical protein